MKKEDIQVDIDEDRVSVRAEVKKEKEENVVYSERSYGIALARRLFGVRSSPSRLTVRTGTPSTSITTSKGLRLRA